MKVLVACESSGEIRDWFLARGHIARSVSMLPSSGPHYQGDILDFLQATKAYGWDLIIALPPCSELLTKGGKNSG